jgi:hypothetical protein
VLPRGGGRGKRRAWRDVKLRAIVFVVGRGYACDRASGDLMVGWRRQWSSSECLQAPRREPDGLAFTWSVLVVDASGDVRLCNAAPIYLGID